MPKRLARYFVCSIILASRCVGAAPMTGNELANLCDETWPICLGYVLGVIDVDVDRKQISISGVFDADVATRISAAQPRMMTDEELHREVHLAARCGMSIDLQARLAQEQVKWDELAPYQRQLVREFWTEKRFDSQDSKRKHCTPLVYSAPSKYCLPSDVTRGQAADVVTKYLRDNPAQRHLPAPGLVLSALRTAFPCK